MFTRITEFFHKFTAGDQATNETAGGNFSGKACTDDELDFASIA